MNNSLSEIQQNISAMFSSLDPQKSTDVSATVNEISKWEEKSTQLLAVPMNEIKTIQDKNFIDCAFKSLIEVGLNALKKMETDLKLGSPAKDKEALALMQNSVALSIEKMSQYLFKLHEMEMFQVNTAAQTNIQTNIINIEASSSDMMDLVEKAVANSEIKKIEAKFKIDTEKSY